MEGINPTSTVLRFGAYSGLLSFLVFICVYYAGYNPFGINGWLGAWIPVLFMALALKFHRDKEMGGYTSYGHAFRVGFMTNFSAALLFCGVAYIFMKTIGGDILNLQINETYESIEKSKELLSEDLYEDSLKSIEFYTVGTMVLGEFFMKMLGGLIISLIMAAIFKKNPPVNSFHDEVNEA